MSKQTPQPLTPLAQLAVNLVALREKGNWSVKALAEQSRVSRPTIEQMELGQANAALNTVDRLARALGVSTGSLLEMRPAPRLEADYVIEAVLAQNLTSGRKRLGLTQQKLGEVSGVSMYVIAHIERQARNPSLNTLAKLAEALCVTMGELLADEGAPRDGSRA